MDFGSFLITPIITLIGKHEKIPDHLNTIQTYNTVNTDYKIGAKTLTGRLKRVIPHIIGVNQMVFASHRFIGENIRFILDLIEHTTVSQIPDLLLFIEFENVFQRQALNYFFHGGGDLSKNARIPACA